jgi:hypothetical protein
MEDGGSRIDDCGSRMEDRGLRIAILHLPDLDEFAWITSAIIG